MKKILSFFLIVFSPIVACAYVYENIEIDGIYYNLDTSTKTAEVTSGPTGPEDEFSIEIVRFHYYTGDVVIPEYVIDNGVQYTVTSIKGAEWDSIMLKSDVSAFSSCRDLTSITIPNSVTYIGDGAFFDCTGLTSVTIPNSVTTIGGDAFNYCTGLTSITIPNSVTTIGNDAFWGCSSLTTVTIGSGVTYMGEYAFYGCGSLTSVTIECPNVGSWFSGLSSIKEIILGENVTSIGYQALSGCSGLSSITIPNSVTSIGKSAFSGCESLEKVIVPDIAAWCGISFSNDYANPLYYAHHIYSDESTEITDLVIPNGVTNISTNAFAYCSSLTSITIPNSVTSIGNNAFGGCSSIEKVIVPDIAAWCGISFSNDYANPLYYAHHIYSDESTEITDLVIPNGVTNISTNAFAYCISLTSVTIPTSVTNIATTAFAYCTGLSSIKVEEWNSTYDSRNDCNAIIKTATNTLIFGCKNTIIPNSVTSIGPSSFANCSGLTSVTIPNSVTSIGNNAFRDCTGLTSVAIPNSVSSIGQSSFSGCTGLTSITIPNSVTIIGYSAFEGCSSLVSITIPSGVKSISERSFYNCSSITNVTIPESVTNINKEAFANCTELADVYCYAEKIPATSSDAFINSSIASATLHVPTGPMEAYKNTAPWSGFGNIVPITQDKCATPTISYANGELTFNCDTEGAVCQSTITDTDISSYSTNKVQLSVTYTISVYATKDGYENSEVATATLCWIDQEPDMEGIIDEDAVTEVKSVPVLIQTQGGIFTIQGAAEGTPIAIYDLEGKEYGTAISEKERTTIATTLRPGSVAVVKIGEKAVKVLLK